MSDFFSLVKHVDVTGGCKSSKGSARSLLMSSSYGSRDGGLTVLRTNMRPDVIMTMEMKPGITGVWSLSSVVENEEDDEEEEEEEEDCFLLFGTNKGKTRLIHFKKEKNEDGGSISIPTPMSSKKVGKNSFLMTETTLLSGNLLNGRVLIQICPTRLRVLKSAPNPKLPTILCSDGIWNQPTTLGGSAATSLSPSSTRIAVDASMTDPYLLIRFNTNEFLLTGVNPRTNTLSSKYLNVTAALHQYQSSKRQSSQQPTPEKDIHITAFSLFRDEDWQGKRNYIHCATRSVIGNPENVHKANVRLKK